MLALEAVRKSVREGDTKAAADALGRARALAQASEPPMISESELEGLHAMIVTMPPEALQVGTRGTL